MHILDARAITERKNKAKNRINRKAKHKTKQYRVLSYLKKFSWETFYWV